MSTNGSDNPDVVVNRRGAGGSDLLYAGRAEGIQSPSLRAGAFPAVPYRRVANSDTYWSAQRLNMLEKMRRALHGEALVQFRQPAWADERAVLTSRAHDARSLAGVARDSTR